MNHGGVQLRVRLSLLVQLSHRLRTTNAAATLGTGRRFATESSGNITSSPRERVDYDVVIVGAGPAGLSAAIRLKQNAAKASKV